MAQTVTLQNGHLDIIINADNIEKFEKACAKYREETRLPETMEEVRKMLLNTMGYRGKCWYLSDKVIGSFDTMTEEYRLKDANFFTELWQAEKLHALACMEQVWIALHNGDFEWCKTQYEYWSIGIDRKGLIGWYKVEPDNEFDSTPFPFRTEDLAAQARKILTDDLIKTAFKVA